ncbi:hypothetical protein BASA60_010802 [Batrachochytrium salamandrivorans]|nr:hypothetical protein BASA60_010802 [Batrachochytrium salamandrivorans]
MLVHHEYPASLEEMMHLVTRIDARLQEHRQERMGSDRAFSNPSRQVQSHSPHVLRHQQTPPIPTTAILYLCHFPVRRM